MKNEYYLHLSSPIPIDELKSAFADDSFPVAIAPVFPDSFLLASDISYSKIQTALEAYFFDPDRKEFLEYVIVKIKQGSAIGRSPRGSE